jgi:hypothetical protein
VNQTPYSPPQTPVADAPPPQSEVRPRAATIALISFALFVVARCYKLRETFELVRNGEISGIGFLGYIAIIGCFIAVGILLAKRVGWARWVVVAIGVWQLFELRRSLVVLLVDHYAIPLGPLDVISWAAPGVFIVATAILVFGPTTEWFRRRG